MKDINTIDNDSAGLKSQNVLKHKQIEFVQTTNEPRLFPGTLPSTVTFYRLRSVFTAQLTGQISEAE